MKTFNVSWEERQSCYSEIEADSYEEAVEKFNKRSQEIDDNMNVNNSEVIEGTVLIEETQ